MEVKATGSQKSIRELQHKLRTITSLPRLKSLKFVMAGAETLLFVNGSNEDGLVRHRLTDLRKWAQLGNTKGGCITVQLTSCLTGLESAV